MSEWIKSGVAKISRETIMILAIGLTMLVSLFAGWNSLAGQIEALRTAMQEGDARLLAAMQEGDAQLLAAMREDDARLLAAMHEGDARLRQERRGDVSGLRSEIGDLRGEIGDLRRELRGEMAGLRTEMRAMGQRIDRLTETVMLVVAGVKRDPQASDTGTGASEKQKSETRNP